MRFAAAVACWRGGLPVGGANDEWIEAVRNGFGICALDDIMRPPIRSMWYMTPRTCCYCC